MTQKTQHHVLAKLALCLTTMLVFVLCTAPLARAAERLVMDDIVGGTNPFPDKISDEQVQSKVDAFSSTHNGYRAATYIYSYTAEIVLADGSVHTIFTNLTDPEYMCFDWLQKYYGQVKQIKFYMVIPPNDDRSNTVTNTYFCTARLKSNVLSNSMSNLIYEETTPTELKINGQPYDPEIPSFKWKNGVKSTTYFEGTYDFPQEPVVYAGLFGYPSQGSQGRYPSLSLLLTNTYFIPRTHFHYVDEAAYRTTLNADKNAPIAQRSNGEGWSSTTPGTKLNIADIQNALTLTGAYNGYYFFSTDPAKGLTPYFSREDTTYYNREFNHVGQLADTTARPSYEEVKEAGPLGFVYVADDIDKPQDPTDPESFNPATTAGKGNYYFSPIIWPDGTLTLDKHYYLLYRQMPTPITIEKTGPDGTALPGVTMDLYRVDPDTQEETLVAKDLSTDADSKIFATSATTVEQEALAALTTNDVYDETLGFVTKDGTTYLAPGTYKLKETSVPRGYAKAEKTFTVDPVQAHLTSKEEAVGIQHITFQNGLATPYPVEYVFSSADGATLPDSVLSLAPKDTATYYAGDMVNALNPEQTSITTKAGTWTFEGYQEMSPVVLAEENLVDGKLVFHGRWAFTPAPTTDKSPSTPENPDNPTAQPVDKVKPQVEPGKVTPATGDAFSAESLVVLGIVAAALLGSTRALRKRS